MNLGETYEKDDDRRTLYERRDPSGEKKRRLRFAEVPIGCVIVYDGRIIARGYKPPDGRDKTYWPYAEIIAMRGGLAAFSAVETRGLYDVRDLWSHVRCAPEPSFRREFPEGGDRLHEPKSRLCRIRARHAPRGRIQPPGGD